jgi:hypothetical protein
VSPERYKRIAFAFLKRIRHLRAMNNAFWNGDLACPGCGRDTNNARCRDCMCGVTPDTPSHVKARAEGYKQGQEDEREACWDAIRKALHARRESGDKDASLDSWFGGMMHAQYIVFRALRARGTK